MQSIQAVPNRSGHNLTFSFRGTNQKVDCLAHVLCLPDIHGKHFGWSLIWLLERKRIIEEFKAVYEPGDTVIIRAHSYGCIHACYFAVDIKKEIPDINILLINCDGSPKWCTWWGKKKYKGLPIVINRYGRDFFTYVFPWFLHPVPVTEIGIKQPFFEVKQWFKDHMRY